MPAGPICISTADFSISGILFKTRLRSRCNFAFSLLISHKNMTSIRSIASICLFTGLLAGCSGISQKPEEIVRSVKVETVVPADSLLEKSFPGIITGGGEINLAFRVAGPIAQIAVKEGDYVRAGQLIARIDPRDYEVQLQAAQAQYDQVKAEAGRVTELHNRQSVTGNDYDKAVAGERMVTAKLKNAKDQLNDTRLLAPSQGYIQKINFSVNELIDAGMPLATLLDAGQFRVETDIPASLYLRRDEIVSYTGIQPNLPENQFELKLLSFSKKASHNQLYKLQLAMDAEARSKLAAGMDIEVKILQKISEGSQLCVSLSALFSRDGKTYVWIYQPGTQTVTSREVSTGKLTGDGRIRISGGLKPEEQVVVAGVSQLGENQKVVPLEPVSETNAGGML